MDRERKTDDCGPVNGGDAARSPQTVLATPFPALGSPAGQAESDAVALSHPFCPPRLAEPEVLTGRPEAGCGREGGSQGPRLFG